MSERPGRVVISFVQQRARDSPFGGRLLQEPTKEDEGFTLGNVACLFAQGKNCWAGSAMEVFLANPREGKPGIPVG